MGGKGGEKGGGGLGVIVFCGLGAKRRGEGETCEPLH